MSLPIIFNLEYPARVRDFDVFSKHPTYARPPVLPLATVEKAEGKSRQIVFFEIL